MLGLYTQRKGLFMRKKRKHKLQLIILMIVTLVLLTVSAFAGNTPNLSNNCYSSINPFTQAGYDGQCTWFAWGRAYEKLGINLKFEGNAGTWWGVNKANNYFSYGSTPRANSLAVWSGGGFGHVAFVEEVSGSNVLFNEANWNTFKDDKKTQGGGYDGYVKTLSEGAMKRRGLNGTFVLQGYIYLEGGSSTDTCNCSTSYAGTYKVSTSGYTLTIRTGHGTSYGVAGSIPDGATVTISKGNGSWAHVSYNGISGYCSMEYLTKINTDTEAPTISNVTVEWKHFTSLGYVVSCDVSDNVGVTKVRFPVWVNDQTGNSAIWFDGQISENHAWAYIPMDMFNYISGTYHMHIYAYDAAGNSSAVAASDVKVDFENLVTKNEKTVREGIYCLKDQNEYWMQAMSDSNDAALEQHGIFSGDMSQQFYVEYAGDGKYHLRAMGASKRTVNASHSNAEIGYGTMLNIWSYNGVIEPDAQEFYLTPWGDGSYAIELASKDNFVIGGMYNGEGQRYYIERAIKNSPSQHWYFCDTSGTALNVTPDTEAPVISSAWYEDAKISSLGYTLNSTVKDNVGVTSVKYKVWKDEDEGHAVWYEVKLNGSLAQYQIPLSDFNYEIGTYHTRIYALDAEGNESKFEAKSLKLVSANLATRKERTVRTKIYCLKDQNTYWMEPVQESEGAIIQQTGMFTGNTLQSFKVEYIGNGKYHLVSVGVTNGLLTVDYSGEIKDGCGLKVTSKQDAAAQEFYLIQWGDGSYAIELASKDNYVIGKLNVGTGEKYLLQKAVYGAIGQHWYFCDTNGTVLNVTPDNEAPVISSAWYEDAKISSLGYTLNSTVKDNVGVTSVKYKVWKDEDEGHAVWYEVKLNGSLAQYQIPLSDFNYEIGTYHTRIYALDAEGNESKFEAKSLKLVSANLATRKERTVRTKIYCLKDQNTYWMEPVQESEGAIIQQTGMFTGNTLQSFKVEYIGNGKYHLVSVGVTNGLLTVDYSGEIKDGCGLKVTSKQDAAAQEFYLIQWGDGSYAIELASKDNYVIGKLNVGTGEKYLLQKAVYGATGQHWYFCDTKYGSKQDVTPVRLTISAIADHQEVEAGETVTVSASATGGAGNYTYSFLIHNLETDKWFRVAPFGTAEKYVWTANGTGEREFFAEVKDTDGTVIRSEAVKVKVKAKNSELSITARTNVSDVSAGSLVTISASAVGGVGDYTYSFLIHNLENDTWYRWAFDKSAEHVWTASGSGSREFFAEVKDTAGTVVRSSAMKVTVKNAATPLAITGKVSASRVSAGNTVTISANATGGTGSYTYSFLIHNLENDTWYRWAFDKNAEHIWTASGSGNREFFAEVKDAAGTVVRSEVMKVTVGDGSSTGALQIQASADKNQVTTGTAVTISAAAAGGSGNYTYSFLVHNLANGSWYRFGDFAAASSYTWTAGNAGTREFFVEAKDGNGTVVRSSAVTIVVK